MQSIDQIASRRRTIVQSLPEDTLDDTETISKEDKLYDCITREYNIKVTDNLTFPNSPSPVTYLFDINNMIKEIETNEEQKKQAEKNVKKVSSKVLKDTNKITIDVMQKNVNEELSLTSVERKKNDALVFFTFFYV